MPDYYDTLVSTDWLAEHLDDADLRVVDIRGYVKKRDLGNGRQEAEYLAARDEYDEAHVPGAVYIDWTRDITDPDDPVPVQVAPPDRFAKLMGSLGFGDDTHVVVYDHTGGQFATRLWWALTYYSRDEGQYTGAVARGEGRPGRVPGARHLHADSLFDPESGTFRSDEELAEKLREAGVPEDREEPVIAYCNGGVAATVPLFVLHRLGYRNLANYDGSWNEWGMRDDLPAERQSPPGE